jgi:hypothetical protein
MRLGMSMESKNRQTFDEDNAHEDIRKLLSGPSQEVVNLLGVYGVSPRTLRK